MKITSVIVLLAVAMQASALSFAWKAANIDFNGTTLNGDSTLVANLIYLGNNGSLASSYSVESITTDMNIVQTKTGMTKKTITDTYSWTYKDNAENGDTFAILLAYKADNKTYYNLSATTYKVQNVTGANSTVDAFNLAAADFNFGKSEAATMKAGDGWVAAAAVPEPATGALALAGVALLLKRRKTVKA